MSRVLPVVLASALVLAGAGPARADLITINLGGSTFTAVGDTVTLTPRIFTLDLTQDVPLTALLQSGLFIVGDSGQTNQTFPGTLARTVTAGAGAEPLHHPDHRHADRLARRDHRLRPGRAPAVGNHAAGDDPLPDDPGDLSLQLAEHLPVDRHP